MKRDTPQFQVIHVAQVFFLASPDKKVLGFGQDFRFVVFRHLVRDPPLKGSHCYSRSRGACSRQITTRWQLNVTVLLRDRWGYYSQANASVKGATGSYKKAPWSFARAPLLPASVTRRRASDASYDVRDDSRDRHFAPSRWSVPLPTSSLQVQPDEIGGSCHYLGRRP